MTTTTLVGRTVALTAATCLITALPAAAQSAEPTSTTATTDEQRPGTSPTASRHRPAAPDESATEPAPDSGEGAIAERYANLPDAIRAEIGEPTADEVVVSDVLRFRDYEHARFYWTPAHGVKIVFGGILDKYLALGAHQELGVPITDERSTEDGVARYSTFLDRESGTRSALYWTPNTGAHEIRGPILQHWRELGAGPALGYPTTDSTHTPDAFGVYNHFVTSGGTESSIYWTPGTGAHAIKGATRAKWAASGWEQGPLGYPTTDQLTTDDGAGRYTEFTGRGGSPAVIVWSPATGAHSVQGLIAQRYRQLDGPNGVLGLPTTDELDAPDGRGRYNHFSGSDGASIYWTPSTGAHEIYGAIRDHWAKLGWERSYLGYPTSGSQVIEEIGRYNDFEHGQIIWYRSPDIAQDFPQEWLPDDVTQGSPQ